MKRLSAKYTTGLLFNLSKVALSDNVRVQYNSAPKTEVVNMLSSTFSPILSSALKPTIPEPGIPLSSCMSISKEQQFDVLALIKDVSPPGPGGTVLGQKRSRISIQLLDGSTMEGSDQVCVLPLTVFADDNGPVPAVFVLLQKAFEENKAVAVFGIQGKKGESGASKPAGQSSASTPAGAETWAFTVSYTHLTLPTKRIV